MPFPKISVVVSTFERPWHLGCCLRSLERQDFDLNDVEIIVSDDGSEGNETLETVTSFARRVNVRLMFTTQPKQGFRLAACRNRAIALSSSEHILFLDGDCIVPRDFLSEMYSLLEPGFAVACDSYRLAQNATDDVSTQAIDQWTIPILVTGREYRRMMGKTLRALIYERMNIAMRPRITGCAFAVAKLNLEQINGFDEKFVGWGLEDRDLQRRLEQLGVRVKTALHRTKAVHLWHPLDPSFTKNCIGRDNRAYFDRPGVTTYCERGLDQHKECRPPFLLFSCAESGSKLSSEIAYLKQLNGHLDDALTSATNASVTH